VPLRAFEQEAGGARITADGASVPASGAWCTSRASLLDSRRGFAAALISAEPVEHVGGRTDRVATRKQQREADFHDRAYSECVRAKVWGFYDITDASSEYFWSLIAHEEPAGKEVLELGCGLSAQAFRLADLGAKVTAIDISPVAIEQVQKRAREEGVDNRTTFRVMDGEALEFDDATFDIVCGSAILHHLDPHKAYSEIARVLRPSGAGVFIEPLGHNRLINWYRNRTPELRTPAEHPLLMQDLALAGRTFSVVDAGFFHLSSLMAIPFRRRKRFPLMVRNLDALDRRLFSINPMLRKHAWFTVFVLRSPPSR
jgi:SAM-dependent methyltransferase